MSRDASLPPSQRLFVEWTDSKLSFAKTHEIRRDGLFLLGDISDPLTLDALVRIAASENLAAEFASLSNIVFQERSEEPDAFEESDRILAALGKAPTSVPRLVLRNEFGAPTFATELHPLTLDSSARLEKLLGEMRRIFAEEPEKIRATSDELSEALKRLPPRVSRAGEATLLGFERQLTRRLEATSANLETPTAYPTPDEVALLLRICATKDDPGARQLLSDVLLGLVQGNFFDQIGGGFFERKGGSEPIRHFKKTRTLARYAIVLFEAYQLTKHPSLRRAARATLDCLVRRLARPGGGFFTGIDFSKRTRSLEAPSREFYARLIGRDFAEPFLHFFGITTTSEGAKLPSSWVSLEKTAARFSLAPSVLADGLAQACELVREEFESEAVNLDERVLFEDTAHAVTALVTGYRVVADPAWLDLALDSYEFLREALSNGALRERLGVFREESFGKGSSAQTSATLRAALSLYETTGNSRLLGDIEKLDALLDEFPESPPGSLETRLVAARVLDDTARVEASERRIADHFAQPSAPEFSAAAFLGLGRALHPRLHFTLTLANEDSEEASRLLGTTYLPFRDEVWLPGETTSLEANHGGVKSVLSNGENIREKIVSLVRSTRPRAYLLDERLEGRALPEKTSAFLGRKKVSRARRTLFGDLEVARVALGTHRAGLDHTEHKAALREALLLGMNVIDTAPTFSFGDAERVVGDALGELVSEGEIAREEVVLLDKIGTFVGTDRHLARLNPNARLFPFRPSGTLDVGFSSLDPLLLRAQLEAECARLGVTTIDLVFLVLPLEALRSLSPRERNAIVGEAFDFLRAERERGTIGAAGFTGANSSELEETFAIADEIGFDPKLFRAASLPVNLVEDASLRGESPLAMRVRERGMTLFAYRPLTDLSADCVRRLVPVPRAKAASSESRKHAEYRVRSLESELETKFLPRLDLSSDDRARLRLVLGSLLGPKLLESNSLEQMEQAEATLVSPALGRTLRTLGQRLVPLGASEWKTFYESYLEAAGTYLAEIQAEVSKKNEAFLTEVARARGKLAEDFPEFALRALLEPKGVDVAVVGIRRRERARSLAVLLLDEDESTN